MYTTKASSRFCSGTWGGFMILSGKSYLVIHRSPPPALVGATMWASIYWHRLLTIFYVGLSWVLVAVAWGRWCCCLWPLKLDVNFQLFLIGILWYNDVCVCLPISKKLFVFCFLFFVFFFLSLSCISNNLTFSFYLIFTLKKI